MPKNIKELRTARTAKASRGAAAVAEFNTLGAIDDRSAEQNTQMTALGAELDTLEAEVAGLDQEIAAEEASIRRSSLFTASISTPTAQEIRTFGSGARTINEGNPETTGGFKGLPEFAEA